MAAPRGRPPELAEIFKAHAAPLQRVGPERRRVVRDIVSCRTPLLGGHLFVCDHCAREVPLYNSCRNRHCPKCQNLEQARWVQAQQRSLLPVEYFHLVFTVPKALHPFFLADRRSSYAFLFAAALESLHDVCRRRLGALPGTIAILHTWTQTLTFHPHLHCIVTGGGLATSGDRWIASRPGFLVPVRVLSKVFKAKLLDRFECALHRRTCGLGEPLGTRLIRQAASRQWVVYAKAPMAGPAQVLRYLSRYTHRIAIGNERLLAFQDAQVTFRYRDRKRSTTNQLTLEAPDFIQRFLLHVVPRRFVRVRHFGLQANGCRSRFIPRARLLLHAPAPPQPDRSTRETWQDRYQRVTGRDPTLCPYCHCGRLRRLPVVQNDHVHNARGP